MLNKKITILELLTLFITVLYAGISSKVFLGFRVVDFLLIASFIYLFRYKINFPIMLLLFSWFLVLFLSFTTSISYHNKFILSDLRFFIIILFGVYSGYRIGEESNFNLESFYYKLMIITVLIYIIIPYIPSLRFYYIPQSFQKDEHKNTVFGPSLILLNYLYIYLVLVNRKRPFYFYFLYLLFAFVIFFFLNSRMQLVVMLFLVAWSFLYGIYDKIKLKHIIYALVAFIISSVLITMYNSERIYGILHPSKDSSFVYRLISNSLFLKKFNHSGLTTQLFGFGPGATMNLHLNDWLGTIPFFILDNGPLTILMKLGWFGLLIYLLILYYPVRKLNLHTKFILLFPIIISMALTGHILYNVLYVFSLYFISFRLQKQKNIQ